jgi:hypothetical protein
MDLLAHFLAANSSSHLIVKGYREVIYASHFIEENPNGFPDMSQPEIVSLNDYAT